MKTPRFSRASSFAVAVATLLASLGQEAFGDGIDKYWGGAQNAPWSTGGNWYTSAAGTNVSVVPTLNDTLYFGTTARTGDVSVYLGDDYTALGLVFYNSNTTLQSSTTTNTRTLSLGANGIVVNANRTGTIGNSSRKVIVALSAAQTWTNASTLIINNNVTNGGFLLTVAGAGSTAVNGIISGTGGGLTKTGTGSLELFSNNTYTGGTIVNQGLLKLSNTTALPTTSALTLSGTGVIGLGVGNFTRALGTSANQIQWSGTSGAAGGGFAAYGGSRTVNLGGSGATVTWNANSFVPNSSALILGASGADDTVTFANPIDLASLSQTIQVDKGSAAIDASLSGTLINGGLLKTGAGTLKLEVANTYSGETNVSNGVLVLSNTTALPTTSALTLTGTGVIGLGAGDFSRALGTSANQIQWTGGGGFAAYSGSRTVNLGGSVTPDTVTWGAGNFVPTNSALILGAVGADSTVTFQNPIALGTSSRTIQVNKGGTIPQDGVISGVLSSGVNGGITKSGLGTLTLSGTNTYTGPTTISQGTLRVSSIGNGGEAGNIGQATSDAGNLVFDGDVIGQSTLLYYSSFAASTDRNFTINNTKTAIFDVYSSNANSPITLEMSGSAAATSGAIVKKGIGKLLLSGSNQYTGATTVIAGTLIIGHQYALGTIDGSTTVASGATLQIQGGISVGNEALTLNGLGYQDIGGALRSSDGNNTYAGLLTLGSATRINSDGDINTLNLTNTSTITGAGNALTVGGDGVTRIDSVIGTGTGTLTKDGTGTLILTGASTFTGATKVSTGTLQLGNGADTGSLAAASPITIEVNGTLAFKRNNELTQGNHFSSVISGAGNVVQVGTGTTYLNGLNSYTGMTSIQAGTLSVTSIKTVGEMDAYNQPVLSALGAPVNTDSGTIAIGSSTTAAQLTYTGTGDTTDRIIALAGTTGGATITQSGTGLLLFTDVANISVPGADSTDQRKTLTLSGSTEGAGEIAGIIPDAALGNEGQMATSLTKAGTGTWTLSGTSSYTGDTLISGGTLQLGNGTTTGTLSTSSGISISSGANLKFNPTEATPTVQGTDFNSVISGSGNVIQAGGTVVLNGTNTYSGTTKVNAGVMNVTGSLASGSAVTVGGTGSSGTPTLAGNGTVNGATTIAAEAGGDPAGKYSPGDWDATTGASLVGVQTFGSTLTYQTGSIFEWQLNSNTVSGRSTNFDGVDIAFSALDGGHLTTNKNLTINSGAFFKLLLGTSVSFNPAVDTELFWNNPHSWQVFGNATSNLYSTTSNFTIDAPTASYTPYYQYGSFSFNNSNGTLNWTAVPEPTSALAGILLGAGLLRRRRK